jgi:6-phosphofructokinase 2
VPDALVSTPGLTVATLTLSPSVDYGISVDKLVAEEKLRADVLQVEPGGGGVQVARALRRLGAQVEAIVAFGGVTGSTLRELLVSEGLRLHEVPVRRDTRPSFTIRVAEEDTNYRVVGRASRMFEPEWRAFIDRLAQLEVLPPYVVLSGSFPPGVPDDLVEQIRAVTNERDAALLVDTSGPPLKVAADIGVEVLKPSREELAFLVGAAELPTEADVLAAADEVLGRGVRSLVVSLGGEGCYVASASHRAWLRPPQVDVASTVAAGDSLVAGLVAGLSRGLPLIESARLGVAAGTGTCLYPGSELFTTVDIARITPQIEVQRV